MEYSKWEDEVTTIVGNDLEMSRSDAQGVVEAQSFIMSQCWGKGLEPKETANYVAAASNGEEVSINPSQNKSFPSPN